MSTINYTYNVIVDRFRQFAAGHFQLRRFTHGEISQADLEKEAEWPWLHVKPRAINYSPGTRSFSFEIFISDLPRDKEDKTGYQAESITDCSLIFQDLINEIYLGNMFGSDVVLTRPVNAEPFVEQYTHTLTGVTGTVELNLDYDWSACSIPASWNYNTPTDSGTDGWGALQFIESLDQNGVFVSLLNDVEAPGNSYYYGTNASGVKGWYAIVDNVGLTCETLPDCATIISIVDDIAALQTDVVLKANTADLGATAFSNNYNDLDNLPTIPSIAGLATVTYVDQQDNLKVDKIAGKGLSTEDYTTAEKSKLAGIQAGAEVNVNADWNAVSGDAQILNKPTIPAQYNPTAGTGISITGTYPNQTITNTAPDQTVALTAGTNIGVTGTYPNFTISNTQSLAGYVPTTRSITINGTTQDLSADRTFTIATNPGTVTSVAALTLGTTGTDLSSTVANGTTTPVITLNVPTASATNRGALSSADWSTFNGKFTLPSLTSGSVLFSNGTTIAQNNANFFWDNTNGRLGIGTSSPGYGISHVGTAGVASFFSQRDFGFNVISQIPQRAYFYGKYTNNLDAGIGIGGNARLNTSIQAFNPNTNTATLLSLNYLGGNVIIGDYSSDAGYKLDVNGTARVSGLTRSTDVFVVGGTATTNTANARFWSSGGQAPTSGLYRGFYTDISWIPSSGSAEWYGLDLRPTINQTGGASGITRGLYINPTLTAAADFRAIEVANGGAYINTTSVAASAILQADSTTKGFLPPRMTTTQKNAITSPAAGLVVYDTTLNKLCVRGASAWETITSI